MGLKTPLLAAPLLAALLALADCGGGSHCTGGAACSPANPCHHGTLACQGDALTCADDGTNLADGTACGAGEVCVAGVCGTSSTSDGGCPGAIAECGPGKFNTCLANDPDDCGDCGIVCPSGRCRSGACFGCQSAQDCPVGQLCADDYCGKPCSFELQAGSEPACDAGFCRPYASSDPPVVNVGICTPGGTASDPGLGAACVGPCAGTMDCVQAIPPLSGDVCSTICDATRADSCPSGWGCDPVFDANVHYQGYGFCRPFEASQAAAGADCSEAITCQPGTYCVPAVQAGAQPVCAAWCDPTVRGTCGSDSCAQEITGGIDYTGIGSCLPNLPNARSLGQSCSAKSPCGNGLFCSPLPNGATVCQPVCDPWHDNCPSGSSCLVLLDGNLDYHGYGDCAAVLANAVSEFATCDEATQNCAANLVCTSFGSTPECIRYCDPLNAATCPAQEWCVALWDALGRFRGVGICNGQRGNVHSGDACATFSDCASGQCYFPNDSTPTGTCIQACALGNSFGCPGGSCTDAGFGKGLGYCVLADGGRWD